MTFSTGTISRCSGNNHFELPITISGDTKTLRITLSEFQADPPANLEEAKEAVLDRLRSAVKEANAATWAQIQTALNSKTFKV